MSYRRSSRMAGVLAVAVLGVLAFAASASAVTPGFLINKTSVGTLKASVTAKQWGRGTLSIPALKIEINCEKFSTTTGFVNSTTDAELQLLYEECTVLINEGAKLEEASGCEIVVNHTGDNRHHITATALLLPTELKDGTPAVLVEKIIAKVLTKEGIGCTLPKTTEIKGEVCLKVDKNDTVEPELLASEELQSLCKERLTLESASEGTGVKDKILYGINEAFITSKTTIALSGAHKGLTFGVTSSVAPIEKPLLCKAKEGPCEAYGLGTKLSPNLESEAKFVFLYEGEELEPPCRVSSMGGATTKEGEEALTGEWTALTFKECGGGLCTVTAQHLPYKFAITATTEGNGTMVWSSGGGGAPAFTIKCLGAAKCIYGATEVAFTITGGSPAKLSNSGVPLKRETGSGEACGETGAKWEGVAAAEGKILYKITTPSPLFVRKI